MITINKLIAQSIIVKQPPSVREYMQNNYVVAFWDGIENGGFGIHQHLPNTWVDLSGNGYDFTSTGDGLTFDKNHYYADGSKFLTATLSKEITESVGTVEIVLQMKDIHDNTVYETPMCFNANGFRILANTSSAETMNRGFSLKGGAQTGKLSNLHTQQAASYAFTVDNPSTFNITETFLNGVSIGVGHDYPVNFSNTVPGLIPKSYRDKNFTGKIYRVALYRDILSDSEIQRHFILDQMRFDISD